MMTKEELINERNFEETKLMLKHMLIDNVINDSEYNELILKFKEKYSPYFDILC